MARQILVHAGFHKTGTSSVQATLQANGPLIWPTHALVLPKRLNEVTRLATLHSVTRGPLSLDEFRSRLTRFLRGLNLGRKRGLILSSENLSGLMPGRGDHQGYDACPDLMAATEACVQEVWGADPEITFLFGLRERGSWLQSAYWQNLRSSRLVEDFESFAARLAQTAPDETAKAVAAVVKRAKVHTTWLEQTRDLPLGPATPLLEMAKLRGGAHAELEARPAANTSPDQEVVAACLAINRSGDTDAEVTAQKEALLRDARDVSNARRIA